ncbi:pseudouridine synthase (plasmid) [Pseudoalteromonas espejiana]
MIQPRQLVCHTKGKPALTTWHVLERKDNMTSLTALLKTGRTHQLRVHCAHHLDLICLLLAIQVLMVKKQTDSFTCRAFSFRSPYYTINGLLLLLPLIFNKS